jgi:hypothetical protein
MLGDFYPSVVITLFVAAMAVLANFSRDSATIGAMVSFVFLAGLIERLTEQCQDHPGDSNGGVLPNS